MAGAWLGVRPARLQRAGRVGGGVGWGVELMGRRALRIIKVQTGTGHAGPATYTDSLVDLTHIHLPCGLLWPNPA